MFFICDNRCSVNVAMPLLVSFCALGLPALSARGQSEQQQIADARSYVNGVNDQAEAIDRYDVAARRERMMLFPDGRLLEVRVLERVMFDKPGNRYLRIALINENLETSSKPAGLSTRFAARMVIDDVMYEFPNSGSATRSIEKPLLQFFDSDFGGVVDYRKLGIMGTGVGSDSFLKALAAATAGKLVAKRDAIDVQLTVPIVSPYSDKQSEVDSWTLDSRGLTVQSYQQVFNIFWQDKIYPTLMRRAQFQWEQRDNLSVPKSAVVEDRLFATRGPENLTGAAEPNYSPTHIDCHWFSVNQPLPDKPFSVDYISNEKNYHAFIDPETNGAISLVAP